MVSTHAIGFGIVINWVVDIDDIVLMIKILITHNVILLFGRDLHFSGYIRNGYRPGFLSMFIFSGLFLAKYMLVESYSVEFGLF